MTQDEKIEFAKANGISIDANGFVLGGKVTLDEIFKLADMAQHCLPQPTPSQSVDERAEFENAAKKEFEQPFLPERDGKGYSDGYLDNAWWGWQARANLSKPKLLHYCKPTMRSCVRLWKNPMR